MTATFVTNCCACRVILLLTNSFDLEDGFLTANNLEQVKDYLASAYPSKYSEVFPQIKNCSLETELETVSCWQNRDLLHPHSSQRPLTLPMRKSDLRGTHTL